MIQRPANTETEREHRREMIQAALLRARDRAREIARQTGTPIVYVKDGQLVREYITDTNVKQADDPRE